MGSDPGVTTPVANASDESLNGRKFDTDEMEREFSASQLEKCSRLRRKAQRLEEAMMLKVRASALRRAGASPDAIKSATVKIHAAPTSRGPLPIAIEIIDPSPPQPGATTLNMLDGGKGGKKRKKAQP